MEIKNKKVWITGASSGIGEEMAYAFAKEGCDLILSGRNEAELERVKQHCKGAKSIEIVQLDLAKHEEIFTKTEALIARIGHVDILVNNAGISQRSLAKETIFDVDKFLINVNLLGTIALTKAVLPSMLSRKSGQIVVVSSLTGKFGTSLRSTYAASKHGLHGFFDSLRAELYQDNIRVLIVCPGFVKTQVSVNAMTGNGTKQGTMDGATEKGISPKYLADKTLQAIIKNKEEIYLGGREIMGIYIKRFFPRLFSKMIRNAKVT